MAIFLNVSLYRKFVEWRNSVRQNSGEEFIRKWLGCIYGVRSVCLLNIHDPSFFISLGSERSFKPFLLSYRMIVDMYIALREWNADPF